MSANQVKSIAAAKKADLLFVQQDLKTNLKVKA